MNFDENEFNVVLDAVIEYMKEKHRKFNIEKAVNSKAYMTAYKNELLLIDSILNKLADAAETYNN